MSKLRTITIDPQFLNLSKNKKKTKTQKTNIPLSEIKLNSNNIRELLLEKLKNNSKHKKTHKLPSVQLNTMDEQIILCKDEVIKEPEVIIKPQLIIKPEVIKEPEIIKETEIIKDAHISNNLTDMCSINSNVASNMSLEVSLVTFLFLAFNCMEMP
jgi:hypothetical protein